jgi:dTDP-4-amino-4,6-dideoxygalactose transaminase
MTHYHIPFNKPAIVGREFDYMAEALRGGHVSGDGVFTKKCHAFLQESLGVPKALLTTNCTHALEMTALLLDLQPGDEVLLPAFTFVSTVNAYALRGATPVFVDIRPDTLNIDERLIEARITPRTKAIVVVHYAGVGCAMDAILEIASRHDIPVIEDNAHGLFGRFGGQYLGTFGALATQSFHETKNFTCGEGGALLINDVRYLERAEIIREKGTNRSQFFRGMVDKYTWVDLGSSYLPSDLLAAYLYAQFECRDSIQDKRAAVWHFYREHLAEWAAAHRVQLPAVPPAVEQAYHMFYLLLHTLDERSALIEHLKARGILSVFHYQPLHLSDMGRSFGGKRGDCPVTESVSDRLLRLPFYYDLTEDDLAEVIDGLHTFAGWQR